MIQKILIIEDDVNIRENVVEILGFAAYSTITAKNGKEGLQKINQEPPDLILCDMKMPGIDGFGLLSILKKNPDTANIPFIFLTGKTAVIDFRKGMRLGADDFISKPFDSIDLLEAVENGLKKTDHLAAPDRRTRRGFRHLFSEERRHKALLQLSQKQKIRRLQEKDVIYRKGEHPRHLYFIVAGQIKIFRTSDCGKKFITQVLNTGNFFGHYALIKDHAYQESAIALSDAEISLYQKEDFHTLLHDNLNFLTQFIHTMADKTFELEEHMLQFAFNSLRKRIANALIHFLELGKPQSKSEINVSREDLADFVGTTRESISRTLTHFKAEGLIEVNRRNIEILDKDMLMELRD